jgi:hypothetical protein
MNEFINPETFERCHTAVRHVEGLVFCHNREAVCDDQPGNEDQWTCKATVPLDLVLARGFDPNTARAFKKDERSCATPADGLQPVPQ